MKTATRSMNQLFARVGRKTCLLGSVLLALLAACLYASHEWLPASAMSTLATTLTYLGTWSLEENAEEEDEE